jgi:hypothetical protein
MYTHEKNNTLRHYLKRKATSANARHGKSSASNLDHVPDVLKSVQNFPGSWGKER